VHAAHHVHLPQLRRGAPLPAAVILPPPAAPRRSGSARVSDLGVPPIRDLIRAADLELFGQKAAQNISTSSNPRVAAAADFTAIFAAELTA
jgi:hypothetical protein